MRRREFLVGAAAVAGAVAARKGWAQGVTQQSKLERIAVMNWSFDKVIKKAEEPDDPARNVDLLDFAQVIADRFGIHNVELQHSYFPTLEPAYLTLLRDRVWRAKSRVSQINLELGQNNIASRSNSARLAALDLTRLWVDRAVLLGCPRVMINQGKLTPDVMPTATTTLRAMVHYATPKGVRITMENRDELWPAMGEIAKAAGAFNNPDVGAFADRDDAVKGIRDLLPLHGGNAHAKTNIPGLAESIALMRELGYTGIYSIEVEPPPADPYPAVQSVIDILLANM
jgi:sugar phosphate isomerase/epimerase